MLRRALVAVVVLCCLSFPAVAGAVEPTSGYRQVGSFGSVGNGVGQYQSPSSVAVEPGTGNILVADRGNDRIDVFSPDPTVFGAPLTTIPTGAGSAPFGLAIDPTSGAIYVGEAGAGAIVRYLSDGAPTPTYSLDSTFSGPTSGAGPGQVGNFASPLAVDPRNSDLLVADTGNKRVSRFGPDGAFLGSFASTEPQLKLISLAVGLDGTVFLLEEGGEVVYGAGGSRVQRFEPGGALLGSMALPYPQAVAVEPGSGRVVAVGNNFCCEVRRLYVFAPGGAGEPLASAPFAAGPAFTSYTGLGVGGGAPLHAYATDATGQAGGVETFAAAEVPGVAFDPPSAVTTGGFHLSGSVAPAGRPTSAHFEYSADDGQTWEATASEELGSGPGEVRIEADVNGLPPNTTYRLRLVAEDEIGPIYSPTRQVTTAVALPVVSTEPASDVDAETAVLHGTVNPQGAQTSYRFEYGTTTGYGSSAPAFAAPAGAGRSVRLVAQSAEGLAPGTAYHFRIVATDAAGTVAGADRTFATLPSGAPTRAYEMVTPVEKGSGAPRESAYAIAGPDGETISYSTRSSFPGAEQQSAPLTPRYLSRRTPTGWTTTALDPRETVSLKFPPVLLPTIATSEDGTEALVASLVAQAPGAVEGENNLYLRDVATGELTLIAHSPEPETGFVYINSPYIFAGGTPDFSRLLLSVPAKLTPDAVGGETPQVYEWSRAEGLTLVSRDTSGTPLPAQSQPSFSPGNSALSRDGRRAVYQATLGAGSGIYLHEDGAPTRLVTASQRTGATGTAETVSFDAITPDASQVIFGAYSTEGLTEDAAENSNCLYRYEVAPGRLGPIVCTGSQSISFIGTSTDGSYVYFQSGAALTPGAPTQGVNVYVAHDGAIKYITNLSPSLVNLGFQVSPDGRYLAIATPTPLTGYDNVSPEYCTTTAERPHPEGRCQELYVYEFESGSLACASCGPVGAKALGDVGIGIDATYAALQQHNPRIMHDDGAVLFDSPEALSSKDANGLRDVYEYRHGVTTLISRATSGTRATFLEASTDGANVFFVTDDRLVGQDTDTAFDIYDARIGGGIAAQNPSPSPVACRGAECPPASVPGAAVGDLGTRSVAGSGNVHRKPPRVCAKKRKGRGAGKAHCRRKRQKRHKHGKHSKRHQKHDRGRQGA